MNFPNYFADAEASFDEADFIIFGVPYDKTSSFRFGSKHGPAKIREASWNFETFNFKTGTDLKDVKFHDYGDLDVSYLSPDEMISIVTRFASKIVKENKFPIAIGGEHSITSGVVKAFSKDVAVLSLDAHIDFRNEYENEKNSHACIIRRISEHIDIENIAVLGMRSAEKKEFEEARNAGLFYIDSFEMKDKGVKNAIEKTKNHLGNKKIYLTLDIDVVDPAYAPETGTPEPFGLTPFDVLEIITSFSDSLVGFDVMEVCPFHDCGQTAILAAKLIRFILEK